MAPRFPLARGWERQLDIKYNGLFYGAPLTPATYEAWLHELAVRFVAVSDADIDYSAQGGGRADRPRPAVLAPGPAHSSLARVRGRGRDADRPGRSDARDARPELHAARGAARGDRIHPSPLQPLLGGGQGSGCVAPHGGFTELAVRRPGPMRVAIRFALGRVAARRAAVWLTRAEHPAALAWFPDMGRRLRFIEARLLPRGWIDLHPADLAVCRRLLCTTSCGAWSRTEIRTSRSATRCRSSTSSARCTCSSSRASRLGDEQALADGRRRLDLPERPLRRHVRGARVHLPAPQRLVLLRPQHVHDRDGDRADRLLAVPDRAAAADARVGLHRRDLAVRTGGRGSIDTGRPRRS